MARIPLVEHAHPRVLMLDFSKNDVDKIAKAGFDVKRGATGGLARDKGAFCLPYPVQDVEVAFCQATVDCFTQSGTIAPSAESAESEPLFYDLFREVWAKGGWSVFFLPQGNWVYNLSQIGIQALGVIARGRDYLPESLRELLIDTLSERDNGNYISNFNYNKPKPDVPTATTPIFKGNSVEIEESTLGELLRRHVKSAKMSVLTAQSLPFDSYGRELEQYGPQPHIVVFGEKVSPDGLIVDESSSEGVLALKLNNSIYSHKEGNKHIYDEGGILLLPDFGERNSDIALSLLQDIFPTFNPKLFDSPQHPWLENYQPLPVVKLQIRREEIIQESMAQVKEVDARIESQLEEYNWLQGLLVSTGDQFASDAAKALRFLGFDVEDVDAGLESQQRKREDYRVRDASTNYFALGEAKTTGKGRGAAEEFISKTQTHINRYAREERVPPPPALLIINFAIDLDPNLRSGRFYQSEVNGRLEDNLITAINSVALFHLCQFVLDGSGTREQIRAFLTNGQPSINTVAVEMIPT